MIQVLKTKLIHNRYNVMSISSVQSYNLVTKNITTNKEIKIVQLENTARLYEYYKKEANLAEKKAMQSLIDALLKHNFV